MKKLVTGLAVFLFLAISLPGVVVAQEDQANTEEKSTARKARIESNKSKIQEKLSETQASAIAGKCKASQVILVKLQDNLEKATENRRSKHSDVTTKLNGLVSKLKYASVDTTELEQAISIFNDKASQVETAIEDYSTTISDLNEMDCEVDPNGFKASLAVAREKRGNIVSVSTELKTYVKDNVKTILQSLREGLTNRTTEEKVEE